MEQSPTAVLTEISHGHLECTYHCREYHCFLSLRTALPPAAMPSSSFSRSSDLPVKSKHDTLKSILRPDISSLCVIPIFVDKYYSSLRRSRINNSQHDNSKSDSSEKFFVRLLPKSYNNPHANNDTEIDNNGEGNFSDDSHPCHELINNAKRLESQLSERLMDASDGAVPHDRENNSKQNPGIYEEFLIRSEAIFTELLSAVNQQIRKNKSSMEAGNDKQPKKRARTAQPISKLSSDPHQPPMNYYSALLRQLEILQSMPEVSDITLHKSVSSPSVDNNSSDDLTRISVTCVDKGGRSHTWHAELYPNVILTVDLPAEFVRSSVERRIALWEGGASMVIILDPERPRGVPILVRFLGATMATMKAAASAAGKTTDGIKDDGIDWRISFARFTSDEAQLESTINEQNERNNSVRDNQFCKNNGRWSEERSVRENLELWFGSSLPSPYTTEKSDYLVECGICYAHRLPFEDDTADSGESIKGPLPEEKCSNPSCNRHYHESCLFEWLHSLPTARVSFDRIFGSCPYCCESVSVKLLNGGN
ncbi:hypothetical protein ACHAXS_003893 [Conticribra weissflogii]